MSCDTTTHTQLSAYGSIDPQQKTYKVYHSYMICNDGQVYKNGVNITSNLKLRAGYRVLNNEHLHRIMMRLFNYDEVKYNSRRFVINHIDMNPLNNSITNLEYATYSSNALNQLPKEYIDELPNDSFFIKTIHGVYFNNPLIYSPSQNQYYRKLNGKYRIVRSILTGNCHYIEIVDNHKKYRFVCDNIVGYQRPLPKNITKNPHTSYYTTKSGERKKYLYSDEESSGREQKIDTLINFYETHKSAINSIKGIKEKTDFINSEIPQYNYSMSTIYKYVC